MNVLVLSRKNAEIALKVNQGEIAALISIADAAPFTNEMPNEAERVPYVLRLIFDDTRLANSEIYQSPSQNDVARIIYFAKFLKEKQVRGTLLVHCEAGVSRSAAAAIICLATWFGPGREGEAVNKIYEVNPRSWPNWLMIDYADKQLQFNGALINYVMDNPEPK